MNYGLATEDFQSGVLGLPIDRRQTMVVQYDHSKEKEERSPKDFPIVHHIVGMRYTDPEEAHFVHVRLDGNCTQYCWSYLHFDYETGHLNDSDLIVDTRTCSQFPALLLRQYESPTKALESTDLIPEG